MFENKKNRLIAIIIGAVLVVTIVATITIVVLKKSQTSSPSKPANQTVKVTKATADALELDAIKILSSDPTKAETILEQAKTQYQELKNANGIADVESQLYLIEHSLTNKPTTK